MIDLEQVGKRIAFLRKERGFTGEALAEWLHVSPQAVSKWENGRCLPETAILPALAQALDCSIDSLLYPRELFILEAIYTDGQTQIPVTHFVNNMVRDNSLNLYVNAPFIGASIESGRLKLLTVKYETPKGIFFSYTLQNDSLFLDGESVHFTKEQPFQIIGAYYGNEAEYASVMQKMKHYEYFQWDRIPVNHETFPSSTASDDTEYLTLIYLNAEGIHVISCPENDTLFYGKHRTELTLFNHADCILNDVMRLSWENGMDCPLAGALYAALQSMGEPCPYHQIMGMSGACYRVCFTDVWDFSCTDALVSYDYATPFFDAIGYSFRFADRLEKAQRKAERLAIMEDLQNGKPVLAINLRVAPEWGIITGYTDNGGRFLCRTYFDKDIFADLEREDCQNPNDRRMVFEDNKGYLFSDFWPFSILHFGEKKKKPSALTVLKTSLKTLIRSFDFSENHGYYQGRAAYQAWIRGLAKESDFQLSNDRENVLRRLSVNDNMLCCLIDARRAAASYLYEAVSLLPETAQGHLEKIAANYQSISDMTAAFRDKVCHSSSCSISYNTVNAFGVSTPQLRKKQISLLENALALEAENCLLAQKILEMPK